MNNTRKGNRGAVIYLKSFFKDVFNKQFAREVHRIYGPHCFFLNPEKDFEKNFKKPICRGSSPTIDIKQVLVVRNE
jgi:hypothetical protein